MTYELLLISIGVMLGVPLTVFAVALFELLRICWEKVKK